MNAIAANQRGLMSCPFCRSRFRMNTVKTNLLAASIINELEIYCSNRSAGCEWRGEIERLSPHIKICSFGKDQVPAWLAAHKIMIEKEEEGFELLSDHDRDAQLEEQTKPLAMRLFKPIEVENLAPTQKPSAQVDAVKMNE